MHAVTRMRGGRTSARGIDLRSGSVVPYALCLVLAGCVATVGDSPLRPGDETTDDGAYQPIVCENPSRPPIAPLVRLESREYERTLIALLGPTAVARAQAQLAALPLDAPEEEGDFGRQDHRIAAGHVETFYRVADAIATAVSTDAALRTEIVGTCASAAVDDACLRSFTERLLRRAYRRAVEGDDVTRALEAAAEFEGAERVHAVVFTTLMAPEFLFRFENRGEADGSRLRLTPYELASRLSYHFWGAPPDDALLEAAERGDLDDDGGYAAQIDRLQADPRAHELLLHFFDEWLQIVEGGFTDGPRLAELRGTMSTAGLAQEMVAEVHDLLDYHLARDGTWRDILTSTYSFARTERLASIYGVAPWDGTSTPPILPAGQRSGILTRAALLRTSDGSTNPFRRGIMIRRSILCDTVRPPPTDLPADALQPPPPRAGASTRENFAAKVVNQPCASCHAHFSQFGYTLEAYDGLGRHRQIERLIAADGEDLGTAPVDTSTVPYVDYEDYRPVADPVELSARIAESEKANSCLARRYFRYVYRRTEQRADGCVIRSLADRLESGVPLAQALREVALEPVFRQRTVEN